MAGTHAYSSIRDFLQGRFHGVYSVIDFDEVDPVLEQSENPFLALEEIVADEEAVSIGNPDGVCVRETGTIAVHCFSPSPHGSNATREIADMVRDSLRFRTINGTRIQSLSAPDPGEMMNSGLWGAAALIVVYERDATYARPA